jgi:hypothetical protein
METATGLHQRALPILIWGVGFAVTFLHLPNAEIAATRLAEAIAARALIMAALASG